MYYAIKHHRAVVDQIVQMNTMGIDFMSDLEPVTNAASNNAMHLLSRRTDIAIGMSVKQTSSGGLKLDLLRGGREFVFEIDEKGRVSLVSGAGSAEHEPISIVARCVNQIFLSEIDQLICDPVKHGDPDLKLIPISGLISKHNEDRVGMHCIAVDTGSYLGMDVHNAKHGFDMLCFNAPVDMAIDLKNARHVIENLVTEGTRVMLGRRFNMSDIFSLHDISTCPDELIRLGVLSCGTRLKQVKEGVNRRRLNAV
jgi:hypothetical protein